MALQDQPQTPPSLVDPTTGQPYPFGSPQYEAAIAPWITGQIKGQAENAANARGAFYSGPAMADEIQAEQGALNTMAQQGAQQSIQEQELAQQEAFAQQEQDKQNQANMDAAKANAKGAMVGGAIQGGGGALGTIGGMAAYNKFFGPHDVQVTDTLSPITEGPTVAPGFDAAGFPITGGAGSPADIASITDYASSSPADFNFATAGPGVGGAGGAGGAAAGAAPGFMGVGGLTAGGAGTGALAALPAAYYGINAGERTFGNTPGEDRGAKIGAGVGGALGMLGGPLAPLTVPLGAAAGGFIGPGIANGMNQAGNWIGARLGL